MASPATSLRRELGRGLRLPRGQGRREPPARAPHNRGVRAGVCRAPPGRDQPQEKERPQQGRDAARVFYLPYVLPIAARLAQRRAAEVAAREGEPPPWQVHEAMVHLALDFQEVREIEARVAAQERRVLELEEALRARGG